MRDLVVVGGGVSGLVAAYQANARGLEVTLLESRTRLGGRVFGYPPYDGADPVDLGPAWVWPESNPRVTSLLDELGLGLFEQYTDGAMLLEANGEVQRYATFQQGSMRIRGGNQVLVRTLSERLDRTVVRTGARVVSVKASATSVKVGFEHNSGPETVEARGVILAVPPRLLAEVAFSPGLPPQVRKRWSSTPTWMAGHAKFVAVYATAFWRGQGLSGAAASRRGPIVELHDHSDEAGKYGGLSGFVGVPPSARANLGGEALERACIEQLVRLFGPRASEPLWAQVKDWALDSHTSRAADTDDLGVHPTVQPSLALPGLEGRMYLAGSEFSSTIPGYLEGAVEAAQAAIERFAADHEGADVLT